MSVTLAVLVCARRRGPCAKRRLPVARNVVVLAALNGCALGILGEVDQTIVVPHARGRTVRRAPRITGLAATWAACVCAQPEDETNAPGSCGARRCTFHERQVIVVRDVAVRGAADDPVREREPRGHRDRRDRAARVGVALAVLGRRSGALVAAMRRRRAAARAGARLQTATAALGACAKPAPRRPAAARAAAESLGEELPILPPRGGQSHRCRLCSLFAHVLVTSRMLRSLTSFPPPFWTHLGEHWAISNRVVLG